MSYLIKQEINTKIDGWLERATQSIIQDGLNWYSSANEWCYDLSQTYNTNINIVAGLTSCFSPMKEWGLNKRMVECYLQKGTCGHTSGQLNKVKLIVESIDDKSIMKALGGRKTQSFYDNIVYPTLSDKVTIDFRMWKFFKSDSWEHLTPNRYDLLEQCIRDKAKENHIIGLQLQSILWLVTKYKYGRFAIK